MTREKTRIRAIFDNGGESLDRYTVIFSDGDMIGLDEGGKSFSQYCGNCVDDVMFHSWGAGWRRHLDEATVTKQTLSDVIRQFENDGNIGQRVYFKDLTPQTQKHIKLRQLS